MQLKMWLKKVKHGKLKRIWFFICFGYCNKERRWRFSWYWR